MPRDARRDLFADAKVILRCRAVILYSPLHSRSEYHPATPDITAEGNITRRKANITEKALAIASAFSWRRHPESNWGMKVLQTSALPLGYGAREKSDTKAFRVRHGADYGARTRHLDLGKVALYQMS